MAYTFGQASQNINQVPVSNKPASTGYTFGQASQNNIVQQEQPTQAEKPLTSTGGLFDYVRASTRLKSGEIANMQKEKEAIVNRLNIMSRNPNYSQESINQDKQRIAEIDKTVGDVVSKADLTTGQKVGMAVGTGLEIGSLPELAALGIAGTSALAGKTAFGRAALEKVPQALSKEAYTPFAGSKVAQTITKATTIAPKTAEEELAYRTAPLLKKGISIAKDTAKMLPEAVSLGYGYDVATGLQDKEGAKAFVPGLTTGLSVALPPVIGATRLAKNAIFKPVEKEIADIISNREKEIFDIESSYVKTKQKNAYKEDARSESRNRIAQTDVLVNSVDQDGKINTKGRGGAIDQYKELTINGREGVVRDLLQQEGKRVKLTDVQKYVEDVINKENKLQGSSLENAYSRLNSTLAGLQRKADAEGYVPLETVHDTKIAETANIDYSKPSSKTEAKTVARGLKELIEKESSQNVKEVNDELAKYYRDIEILEDLDGKRVKGGRLGKYFAQGTGNIVGALTGHAVGGPFGGAIGAVIGGEATAKIAGQQMSKTFGKAVGKKVPESKVLKKAEEKAKQPKLALPAPKWGRDYVQPQSKSLGNLNAQYNNIKTTNSTANISDSIPQNRQEVINNFNHYFESTDKPQIINYIDKEGNQVAYRTPTSMPKSLPDNLRKRELFNRVEPYWKTQVRPTKKGLEQQLYDELQKLVDKEVQNTPLSLPKGDTQYFGATAGIQTDEEGNVTFDPKMAALGVAGMSVAKRIQPRDTVGKFTREEAVKAIKTVIKNPLTNDVNDTLISNVSVLENKLAGKSNKAFARKELADTLKEQGLFDYEGNLTAKDDNLLVDIAKKAGAYSDELELSLKAKAEDTVTQDMMKERMGMFPKSLEQEAKKYKSAEEFASNYKNNPKIQAIVHAGETPETVKIKDLFLSEDTGTAKLGFGKGIKAENLYAGRSINEPILVLGKNTVIDGHTRIQQAIANGEDTIKIYRVKPASDVQSKLTDIWNKANNKK